LQLFADTTQDQSCDPINYSDDRFPLLTHLGPLRRKISGRNALERHSFGLAPAVLAQRALVQAQIAFARLEMLTG
jgi:hypothetical protein